MLQNYWRGQHKLQKVGLIMKVENLTNARGKKVANQFIITNGNVYSFQSYDSEIVRIDYDNVTITIGKDYSYSNTTVKHRNEFFRQMFFPMLADSKGLEKAIKDGYICKANNTEKAMTVIYDENMR